MNTTQPKIRTTDGKWPRFVIVRESPEPDHQQQFWGGEKWVRELRTALLYAHEKFVRKDLKKMQGEG
jgi:hypothetical protein